MIDLGKLKPEDKAWKYLNISVLVVANILYMFLALHRNFWYDEAYTAAMIRRSFAEIVEATAGDVHSPFYYCVVRIFYLFPGMGQSMRYLL